MGIDVEVLIRVPMDTLWTHTQDPALHQRWDLRFSEIRYLPRPDEAEPQQFVYATRIGFGLAIEGRGESVATRDLPGGGRVSSLKFCSDNPLSLIREGAGYWKYVPTPEGIAFRTWYDYRTRFGALGAWFDRLVFRPLMAWATAWSFDRLRLWVERGITPSSSLLHFATHAVARITVALVFAYHGLVPKLLRRDADEVALLEASGVPSSWIPAALTAFGVAELVFALVLLACWTRRWPSIVGLALMVAATLGVAATSPGYLLAAFNPLTLNLCVAALCVLDLVNLGDSPSASHCRYSSRGADR